MPEQTPYCKGGHPEKDARLYYNKAYWILWMIKRHKIASRNKEMIEKVETSPLTDGDRQDTLTDNDGQEGR